MRPITTRGGLRAVAAAAVAVTGLATAGAAQAAPAPVPCSSIGSGKYDCQFYPAGNGITAGAPVQASNGAQIGYLNQGTNWVTCQLPGATDISGAYQNNWWAYTEANDGRWGWVNAVWAKGGDNFGKFQGVPACPADTGLPPGGQGPPSGSTITPPPVASPSPAPPAGSPRPAPRRHLRVRLELDWHVTAARTRIKRVRFFHLPSGARVSVHCRGRRCRLRSRGLTARAARRVLIRTFTSGDDLRLTITHAGYVPWVADVRFRTGRGPRGAILSR